MNFCLPHLSAESSKRKSGEVLAGINIEKQRSNKQMSGIDIY
jgi:hypothetical protein